MSLYILNGTYMLQSCGSARRAAVKYECPNAIINLNQIKFS